MAVINYHDCYKAQYIYCIYIITFFIAVDVADAKNSVLSIH